MAATRKYAKYDGYVLLALGALLIWIGGIFDNTPNWAHHKLLVSSPATAGSFFEKTVILMLQHRKEGSFGLVVNRPDKSGEFYIGGPMQQEKIYALHSTDVIFPDSMVMQDIDTAVLQSEGVEELKNAAKKPEWYIILHGYAGWGKRQLNLELAYGGWRVVEADKKLLRATPPEKMWDAATAAPALQLAD